MSKQRRARARATQDRTGTARAATRPVPKPAPREPAPWWYEAFPELPYEKSAPGAGEMLTIVAYDISDDKRLRQVARICEDYGVRVQYSIFECHLDAEAFNQLWLKLLETINEEEDRICAYKLDARAAREIETAGTMVCAEKSVCYLV